MDRAGPGFSVDGRSANNRRFCARDAELVSEAPRSGLFSLAPVLAKELKERAFQGVLRALLLNQHVLSHQKKGSRTGAFSNEHGILATPESWKGSYLLLYHSRT